MSTPITAETGMKSFLAAIKSNGGMATSNMYAVEFEALSDTLKQRLVQPGFADLNSAAGAYASLTMLCEEASLPGMMANSGQTTGVFMGEGQVNYAHTKSYTDITLGWTCDANLLPLKFINAWIGFIFGDDSTTTKSSGRYKVNRVQYPDEYQCQMKIIKAERNASASLGRVSGIYTLYDAWPYSIQATPLSYGATSLLKVSASFYYRRWDYQYINIPKS